MDRISELVGLIRQANAWNTVSSEEIIEQALLEFLYGNSDIVIELRLPDGRPT